MKEQRNFAGAYFFKMFSYPLLLGNAQKALNSSSGIVISRKMAEDFFGSAQGAMEKSIRYENEKNYIITAVFENLPSNSSDKFDYLISWQSFIEDNEWATKWDVNSPRTYIMLRADATASIVEKKVKDLLKNYNKSLGPNLRIELVLKRSADMYFRSEERRVGKEY